MIFPPTRWSFIVLAVGLWASCLLAKADDSSVLVFAGDIMLAETAGDMIARGADPFQYVAPVLKTADLAIGNLECVVATKGEPMKDKPFTFRSHPRVLPVVAQHFDVVSLANNHTGDFGHAAFLEQLDLLAKQKLAFVGGGKDCLEARTPRIVEVKGIRIALLAYNDYQPREFEAGPSWPGVAWAVDRQMEADIRAARTVHHADVVIPFMHWGDEHEPANDKQHKLARRMIKAGADAVVGGHPHVTQGVDYEEGKLVVFSLGNFVFNGFKEGPARIGWMLRLRVDRQGVSDWDTVAVHLDDNGCPHPVNDAVTPCGNTREGTILNKRAMLDSVFGPKR